MLTHQSDRALLQPRIHLLRYPAILLNSQGGGTKPGPVQVLSNVDDVVFGRTKVARLVEPDDALTGERLHAYEPHPAIYQRARQSGEVTPVG